ncbi:MAG: hypothetical protein JSW59_17195 [Phycisphaerales bacterium]|nr:MAG: hypothetical protein JSW59_17195 [Phycisphaerales bacterium]
MDRKEQLVDAVLRSSEGGRKKLSCAEAFDLARKCDARVAEIGRICNDNKVKICKCQLGCFK